MSAWAIGLVGAGGVIGSLLRYGAGRLALRLGHPAHQATLAVNLVGSFAMGLLISLGIDDAAHRSFYLFGGVGVLGGLTTYSALNVQKATLWSSGRRGTLAAYLVATYAGGMLSVAAGAGLGYLITT